jgi:hypothetical protein
MSSGGNQAKGATWVMEFTKGKNLTPANTSFEEVIDASGKFTADVVFDIGQNQKIYYECKYWDVFPPGLSNVPNQMINYFNTQTDLANFVFYFKAAKPDATQLNAALKANKGLFKVDQVSWDNYKVMFKGKADNLNRGDVDDLIDIITKNFFNDLIK